ncbi:MAG: CHRD domain-containing protein [Chitinophagaceae bacterium]
MKLIKLTVFASILFSTAALFTSCESDAEQKKTTDFQKTGIILSGSQETPANASTALGTMDVFYTRETRILSYTVTWTGLTDSISLMHIHGLASPGFAAPVVQNIIVAPSLCNLPALPNCNDGTVGNGIFPQKTIAHKFTYLKSGTISATLLVDGVVIKEADLLNGNFYMNIHTPAFPAGEIRGQIKFQ